MLEIKHVSKKYKTKHNEVHALQDINLIIQEKGMVFILGKSGSGKSTLLNVLGGLDSFDEGEIIIGGKSSKTFKQSDFDSYRNTFIGFIFQEYNVMDNFTVKENIALAMQLQGKKASDEEIERILEEVDLKGLANRKPNELSGGQLQRVAIARALIKQPEIIMADEPTGALDSKTGKQVFDTLKKLSKDKLVLIVSHDKEFAKRYADRIIELKDGKIVQDLSKQMVQADESNSRFHYVENAYIQIPNPQVLSMEDLDTILSQMKKHQGEIIIALDEQVNQEMKEKLHMEEGGQAIFQQTNIEMRDTKKTKPAVSFIKSKLPLQSSFKLACANLKLKPFRLAITIILSVVAFTLFGITNTMSQYNKETATFRSMKDTDVNYISIGKNEVITYDDYSYEEATKLTNTDYERLQNNFSNVSFIQTFSGYNYGTNLDFSQQIADIESLYGSETNYLFYPTMLSALSTITTQDIEENGFTLTGKLAEKDDEIVITKVVADTLMTYGFMEENKDGVYVKKSLQSIEDLLSKTITLTINNESVDFTITGILDTKIDFSRYEALKLSTTESLTDFYLQNELTILLQDSYHQLGYVSSTRLTKEIQQYDIYALSNIGFIDILVQDEYHSPMYAYSSQDVDSNQLVTISDGDLYVSYQQIKNVVIHNAMTLQDYIAQSVSDTMRDDEIMQLVKEAIQTYQKDILHQVQIELYYDDGRNVTGTIAGVYVPQELTSDDSNYIVVKEDQLEAYGYQKDGYSYFTVAAMSDDETLQNIIAYTYDDGIENSNYILQNQVMPMLETVNSVVDALQGVLLWIGVGFAIFASVMFCNFIATSIANKQREIGILRAVGARGFDVLKIFLNESFMIAICNWILAVVLCFIATNVMNEFIRDSYGIVVTIFHFGILQILLLCIIAIAVACIASAFPVLKISCKKPIDAIKNRK